MKTSAKILVGIIIALSLVICFLIGVLINFPSQKEMNIAGTIGKINNSRNSMVTENDIKLRSELQSNNLMMNQYQQYYSFHYTSTVRLRANIDEALKASQSTIEFTENYQEITESLSGFSELLDKSGKELLKVISALQNLSDNGQQNIGSLINNANNALAQVNYNQIVVVDFIAALEQFFTTHDPDNFPGLKKSYDLLNTDQERDSANSKDKPIA